MDVTCPFCKKPGSVPGPGQYRCKSCGAEFKVLLEPESGVAEAPAPAGAGAGAVCPKHPERQAIDVCARCGTFICTECLKTLDGARYCPDCIGKAEALRTYCPWEDRRKLGLVPAAIETAKAVILQPGEFFKRMPRAGGLENPLYFAVAIGMVGIVVTAIQMVAQVLLGGGGNPFAASLGQRGGQNVAQVAGAACGAVLVLVGGPIIIVIQKFIAAAVLHLCCLVAGAKRFGFETTLRICCYQCVGEALSPVTGGVIIAAMVTGALLAGEMGAALGSNLGALLSLPVGLYSLYVTVLGVREGHEVSTGQALVAVLLPIGALIGCMVCAGGLLIAALAAR